MARWTADDRRRAARADDESRREAGGKAVGGSRLGAGGQLQQAFLICAELMEVEEGEGRQAALSRLCEGDEGLADAVRDLMESQPSDFLGREVLNVGGGDAKQLVGTMVGPYDVKKVIGEGGMGWVYLAEKTDEEFKLTVALKVLKGARRGSDSHKRFLRERQHLANLIHPNIGRLYDGGVTDDDLPYLAMEYIDGEELDAYIIDRNLDLRERIKLFIEVCKGVFFAHNMLVVHRDIKPSNILVGDDGVPKLLDFGIAKSLDAGATMTVYGRAMTPAYASPEQIRASIITVGSDIYSLGALLCVLVSGHLPYHDCDVEDPDMVMTAIVEKKALRPSEVARMYGDVSSVGSIQGDLDAIVLRCLEKDPADRYKSVGDLISELERFLAGEPVHARGNDIVYLIRRFVRYYRWRIRAAAVVFLLVVVGAGFYVQQAEQVRIAGVRAQRSAERTQAALDTLVEMMAGANPRQSLGRAVTLEEVLAGGAAKVRAEMAGEPDLRATLLDAMGEIYLSLGDVGQAEELHSEALEIWQELYGEEHRQVALAQYHLGEVYRNQWDFEEAKEHYRAALGTGSLEPLQEARAKRGLGRALLRDSEQGDEARLLLMEALSFFEETEGSDVYDVFICKKGFALLEIAAGRLEDAERILRAILEDDLRELEHDHPDVADVKGNLGAVLYRQGRLQEGLEILEEAVSVLRRNYGDDNINMLNAVYVLGSVYFGLGRKEEAEVAFREVTGARGKWSGSDANVVSSLISLGRILADRGEFAEAEMFLREGITVSQGEFGLESQFLEAAWNGLAEVLLKEGRLEEAEVAYVESGEVTKLRAGVDDRNMAFCWLGLGRVAKRKGDCEVALGWFDRADERFRTAYGRDYVHRALPLALSGECFVLAGETESALAVFVESRRIYLFNGFAEDSSRMIQLESDIERLSGGD